MKKIFYLFITAILAALITSNVFAKNFSDINSDHPNFNAINYLSAKKIIKGYTDGAFKPEQKITRAELTKMILVGKNFPIKKFQGNCFPDVGYLEWYSNYICTAKEANFIKGYDDGTFKPEQFINKVEALKIIAEIYEWKTEFEETLGAFSDTPYDSWYINYILYGIEKNLFQGFNDDYQDISLEQFKPGEFITRAEVAEILYRYLIITELNKNSFYPELKKIIQDKSTIEKSDDEEGIELVTDNSDDTIQLEPGAISIILNWEAQKDSKIDFDSHLIQPNDEEINFAHKVDSSLETLLETKNEAEILNIFKIKKNEKINGKINNYLYFVHNYSGDKPFGNAKVKIEIYDKNGLAKIFTAYKHPGKIWKIFEINENYELTIFNEIGGCELINRNSTVCPKEPLKNSGS